jgi:hypothetical protein
LAVDRIAMKTFPLVLSLAGLLAAFSVSSADDPSAPTGPIKVPLVFQGGHDTDAPDHGRPVVLVAAALGVPVAVFRDAFSHVHPAPAGEQPTQDEVRENKRQLLSRLAPYGVTNERLDEVSNYYRYRPQNGEMWRHVDAAGYAIVKDGKILKVTITEPGAGYTTPPKVVIQGVALSVYPLATLSFGTDLTRNGSVLTVVGSPIGDGDHAKPALVPDTIDLPQAAPLPPNIQKVPPPPPPPPPPPQ